MLKAQFFQTFFRHRKIHVHTKNVQAVTLALPLQLSPRSSTEIEELLGKPTAQRTGTRHRFSLGLELEVGLLC